MQFMKRLVYLMEQIRGMQIILIFRIRRIRSSFVGEVIARVLARVHSILIIVQVAVAAEFRSVRCLLSSTLKINKSL